MGNRAWIDLHLRPVRWSGEEATIRCPHPDHEDHKPSAGANASKGVWKCHGCGRMGTLAQLADILQVDPPMAGQPQSEPTKEYAYQDAQGTTVFNVVCSPGKKFWIRGANGTGLPREGRGLPYRLPEVIAAAKRRHHIVVVEGEKDADRLAKLGVPATCNAMGAGKWTKRHARRLPKGSKVVVMGDADLAGMDHMVKVATTCAAAGHEVRILPPEALGFEITQSHGRDISDWLDEGNGADELRALEEKFVPFEEWCPPTRQATVDGSEDNAEYALLARQILRRHAHELLLADDGDYGAWYTLDERGIWQAGGRRWIAWLSEIARELGGWDEEVAKYARRVLRLQNPVDLIRRQLAGVLDDMRKQGEAPAVTECHLRDLDSNTRYLGAANGVVDLHKGELLSPDEARRALVTVSAPTEFHRGATHPEVERLFAHLPKKTRRWWWTVLAYHLRGDPSRRVYLIVGPAAGGKTALLIALLSTLGPSYVGQPADDALEAKVGMSAGLSPELEAFTAPHRFAFFDEISTLRVSAPKLKRLSGGGEVTFRRLHEQLQTRPATATIFLICNPGSVPRLRLQDPAMVDRLRVLPYPAVDNPDPGFLDRIKEEEFRRALLWKLVKMASEQTPRHPPEDVEQVSQATAARVVEDKGEIGAFAQLVRRGEGILTPDDLWNAWCNHNGGSNEKEKVGGYTRNTLSRALRDHISGLGPSKPLRADGEVHRGWKGWKVETKPGA